MLQNVTDPVASSNAPEPSGASGDAALPPARKRRWVLWGAILLGALVLLAAILELTLRLILPGIIANSLRDAMSLTDDHPVEVHLHGSAAWYALGANIGPVEATIPDAYLVEGLRGTLELSAERVPFNVSKGEIIDGTAWLTVDRDQLPKAIQLVTQGVADSGEVRSGELFVSREIEAFGLSTVLAVSLTIEVDDGAVTVDPRSIEAAGFDLSAEEIRSRTGGALDGLISPQTVCIQDRMPAGLTLTDVELSSTGAVRLAASFAPTVLSDPAMLEPGVCETP